MWFLLSLIVSMFWEKKNQIEHYNVSWKSWYWFSLGFLYVQIEANNEKINQQFNKKQTG